MIEAGDGRILLSPAEVVEKNQMDQWRTRVRCGESPPPPEPLSIIPPERHY